VSPEGTLFCLTKATEHSDILCLGAVYNFYILTYLVIYFVI